jgi:Recombination endonuclease VII
MPYKDPQKRKEYHKQYHKKWRLKNLDSIKTRGKKYFQDNKERIYKRRVKNGTARYNRAYQIKSRYGILESDYNNMLIKQNKLCCICRQEKELCIDHDHKTGKIRGLLCRHCNSGLGLFKDDKGLLLEAIKYLLKG